MDVTPQAGEALARRLQAEINETLHLPCSFGVATNKLVAKIANNVGKDRAGKETTPNAIMVVPPGEEAAFLAPLGIRELWGIGPKTAEKLRALNINTIGDLASWNERDLVYMFGKHGGEMALRAKGIDNRPVETEHDAKSVSKETTFARDVNDLAFLRQTIRQLAEGVGWRVRKAGLRGNTVRVKIRWSDFTTLTRQQALPQATDDDTEIERVAQELFRGAWTSGQAVRLIGVGVSGFDDSEQQLGLWQDETADEKRRLQATLDDLKSRFGESIVKRGSDLRKTKD
jgi:DNA polymerase-4